MAKRTNERTPTTRLTQAQADRLLEEHAQAERAGKITASERRHLAARVAAFVRGGLVKAFEDGSRP